MPRDHRINIYSELDITNVAVNIHDILYWCEQNLDHGWNIVADSGPSAVRGNGKHIRVLLCEYNSDIVKFKLRWS